MVTENMSYTNNGFDREVVEGIGEEVEGGDKWVTEIRENRYSPTERGLGKEVNGPVMTRENSKENICVIGSGDFGRALAGRLATAGYKVTIASRDPERNR